MEDGVEESVYLIESGYEQHCCPHASKIIRDATCVVNHVNVYVGIDHF